MMAVSEHNLSCFCGQPLETIASSVSVHCPRCGLTNSLARLADSGLRACVAPAPAGQLDAQPQRHVLEPIHRAVRELQA
jgi:predicted RNA-binding Zn-ribbon protein involved in translation (DUF1610 family)